MEIQNNNPEETHEADLEKVAIIARRYKEKPEQFMRILFEAQAAVSNALPREVAAVISRETGIPEVKLYGFITFYSMFSTVPRGKYVVRMCKSGPCYISDSPQISEAICAYLDIQMGETTADGLFTLEYCECLGICDISPAIMINEKTYGNLTPRSAVALIKRYQRGEVD